MTRTSTAPRYVAMMEELDARAAQVRTASEAVDQYARAWRPPGAPRRVRYTPRTAMLITRYLEAHTRVAQVLPSVATTLNRLRPTLVDACDLMWSERRAKPGKPPGPRDYAQAHHDAAYIVAAAVLAAEAVAYIAAVQRSVHANPGATELHARLADRRAAQELDLAHGLAQALDYFGLT